MTSLAERMTVSEFFAWVETQPEHPRYQLIEGEVLVSSRRPLHQMLAGRIYARLLAWTEEQPGRGLVLLPIDVVLNEFNDFAPDVSWIAERNRPDDLRALLPRVPELCIEVRSPSTWRYDIGPKLRVYEAEGLPELWLVDDRSCTVLVFRRSAPDSPGFDESLELGEGEALGSPQLPGFELAIDELFAATGG